MHWWFRSIFVGILLLSGCSFQSPQEALETTAIQSLSLTPTSLTVNADSQTGMFVTSIIQAGDTLQMGLQAPPPGITASFTSRAATTTIRSFLMTLNVAATVPAGTYTIRVAGTTNSSKLERRIATFSLTVVAPTANPSFRLIPEHAFIEITRGKTKSLNVFVSRTKGFNQAISLSLDTTPSDCITAEPVVPLQGVSATPVNLTSTALSGTMTLAASSSAGPVFLKCLTNKLTGVAGSLTKQTNLAVMVRMPAGEPDPSFANDGTLDQQVLLIALQSNNKVITLKPDSSSGKVFSVERFNEDGSPDTAFGTLGKISLDLSEVENPAIRFMVVDGNNKILVLAEDAGALINKQMRIFRLRSNGTRDTTFGNGTGKLTLNQDSSFNALAMAIQPDGKVVIGLSRTGFTGSVIMRILADGSDLDTGFASQGLFPLTDFGTVQDIALQSDGKMVVVGKKTNATKAAIARILSQGGMDGSFGTAGIVEVDLTNFTDEFFNRVEVDASNRIVAAGVRGSFVFMARVNSAGSPDTTFSGDGFLSRNNNNNALGFNPSQLRGLLVQPDGKQILVLTNQDSSASHFLLRQTESGAFDTTFSSDGKLELGPILGNEGLDLPTLQDVKGRIVIGGGFKIARIAL